MRFKTTCKKCKLECNRFFREGKPFGLICPKCFDIIENVNIKPLQQKVLVEHLEKNKPKRKSLIHRVKYFFKRLYESTKKIFRKVS